MTTSDVVIIGAGVIGAACAYFMSEAGLSVQVIDRGGPAAGTSSAGEGNILVSDKEPGPELNLALYSQSVWRGDLAEFGALWEFEDKGGLVVAAGTVGALALNELAVLQKSEGIRAEFVDHDDLPKLEPQLTRDVVSGTFYPDDAQVQPMLVVAHLLRIARRRGVRVTTGQQVVGFRTIAGRVGEVLTTQGRFSAPIVINAAGPWAGDVAELAGGYLPVLPRRGFVLVTEPRPGMVRHKVYAAEYVGDVASSDAQLQASPVVEGTPAGTILIGSTRERVGFDRTLSLPAIRALANNAIKLFPTLAHMRAIRCYSGYRPYCPDHLPVIGEDPLVPGLWHVSGHEGAGIGLAAGTGKLMAQVIAGQQPDLDLTPFAAHRFRRAA